VGPQAPLQQVKKRLSANLVAAIAHPTRNGRQFPVLLQASSKRPLPVAPFPGILWALPTASSDRRHIDGIPDGLEEWEATVIRLAVALVVFPR
jgi:hypothetical protein